MVKMLDEMRAGEIGMVIEHIRLELQTALGDPAFMLRRIEPLVGLAYDAGFDAAERAGKVASDAAKHLDN